MRPCRTYRPSSSLADGAARSPSARQSPCGRSRSASCAPCALRRAHAEAERLQRRRGLWRIDAARSRSGASASAPRVSPHSVMTMLRRLELRLRDRWCGRSASSPPSSSRRGARPACPANRIPAPGGRIVYEAVDAFPCAGRMAGSAGRKRSDVSISSMRASFSLACVRMIQGASARSCRARCLNPDHAASPAPGCRPAMCRGGSRRLPCA